MNSSQTILDHYSLYPPLSDIVDLLSMTIRTICIKSIEKTIMFYLIHLKLNKFGSRCSCNVRLSGPIIRKITSCHLMFKSIIR